MTLQTLKKVATPLLLTLLIAGCSSIQKNQALLNAEDYYSKIKQNEDVARYAPAELKRAEEALKQAALSKSKEDMSSLAYVATTRAQTALAVAERKVLRAKLKELDQLRNQELVKARDLEISREKDARKRAQMEREAALAEAEALRLEKAESLQAAEALRLEMEALQAVKTERGMVMTLGDVLFATGKSELQPGAMSTIERLAAFLDEYTDKTVLIEGHTDNVGADSYNQTLSEQRAEAVSDALLQLDVEPGRINTVGYGESRPLAENSTPAGRLKNRRVEIVIRD